MRTNTAAMIVRALAATAGAAIAAAVAIGAPASADEEAPAGVPSAAPPAAFFDEPVLPAPDGWPLSEGFPRTSGTARYDDGALLWTDWLYDDTGDGSFTYRDEAAVANGADVFRAAVGVHRDRSFWRVDWNTLVDPDLPLAVWGLDMDDDAGTGTAIWPAGAGVSSPGIDAFLVVSSRGIRLEDVAAGTSRDLAEHGAEVVVDEDARSFVVSIPRSALRVNGTWTVRLATGVADESGQDFAPPPGDPESRVYNAAFRTNAQEDANREGGQMATSWNNGAQSEALSTGDISPFSMRLDWSRLVRGEIEPEPSPTGFSVRWYGSSVELGQGLHPEARQPQGQPPTADPRVYGRVQPYTVYVPAAYDPSAPVPLTLLLHGGGGNHNGFRGPDESVLHTAVCEDRGSICVAPLGRGDGTWYVNEAELDVWEVWNRVSRTYAIDPDRTTVAGWSMGGVGATRLAVNHPDVFAGVGIVSGAGYMSAVAGRDGAEDPLRVENLGALRVFMDAGTADIAEQNTRDWEAAFQDAGVPYRAHYYAEATHGHFGVVGWPEFADRVDGAVRETSPPRIAYRWDPREDRDDLGIAMDSAYWVDELEARDEEARWSRLVARSGALDTVVTEPTVRESSAEYAGRATEVRELVREEVGEAEPTNDLDLDLTNIASASVDLDAAGFVRAERVVVHVATDGPTDLVLRGAGVVQGVSVDAGRHRIVVE